MSANLSDHRCILNDSNDYNNHNNGGAKNVIPNNSISVPNASNNILSKGSIIGVGANLAGNIIVGSPGANKALSSNPFLLANQLNNHNKSTANNTNTLSGGLATGLRSTNSPSISIANKSAANNTSSEADFNTDSIKKSTVTRFVINKKSSNSNPGASASSTNPPSASVNTSNIEEKFPPLPLPVPPSPVPNSNIAAILLPTEEAYQPMQVADNLDLKDININNFLRFTSFAGGRNKYQVIVADEEEAALERQKIEEEIAESKDSFEDDEDDEDDSGIATPNDNNNSIVGAKKDSLSNQPPLPLPPHPSVVSPPLLSPALAAEDTFTDSDLSSAPILPRRSSFSKHLDRAVGRMSLLKDKAQSSSLAPQNSSAYRRVNRSKLANLFGSDESEADDGLDPLEEEQFTDWEAELGDIASDSAYFSTNNPTEDDCEDYEALSEVSYTFPNDKVCKFKRKQLNILNKNVIQRGKSPIAYERSLAVIKEILFLEKPELQSVINRLKEERTALNKMLVSANSYNSLPSIPTAANAKLSSAVALQLTSLQQLSLVNNTLHKQMSAIKLALTKTRDKQIQLAPGRGVDKRSQGQFSGKTTHKSDKSKQSHSSDPHSTSANHSDSLNKSKSGTNSATSTAAVAEIQRFHAAKVNKLNSNTERLLELDLTAKTLSVYKKNKLNQADYSARDILINMENYINSELSATKETQLELNFFLSSSAGVDKQGNPTERNIKCWKLLFGSREERERFYRLLQLVLPISSAILIDPENKYVPRSLQLSAGVASRLSRLPVKEIAAEVHSLWCLTKKEEGYKYAPISDESKKFNSQLVNYAGLPAEIMEFKRRTVFNTLGCVLSLGFSIESNENSAVARHNAISRDLLLLLPFITENNHDLWGEEKLKAGWSYGPQGKSTSLLKHPNLTYFRLIPHAVREKKKQTAYRILTQLIELGYYIKKTEARSISNLVGNNTATKTLSKIFSRNNQINSNNSTNTEGENSHNESNSNSRENSSNEAELSKNLSSSRVHPSYKQSFISTASSISDHSSFTPSSSNTGGMAGKLKGFLSNKLK
jgi:hypothetical protein